MPPFPPGSGGFFIKTMKHFRSAHGRGSADFGWLQSRQSFSFGDYYDPTKMGWGPLRVINDDRIAGGAGFPMHPHRNMEIFSYVTKGALTHRDSLGNQATIGPGRIQFMRAGSGIRHSEFNPLENETTHLLQIWIEPEMVDLDPAYAELDVEPEQSRNKWKLLLSPDGADGSIVIRQQTHVRVTVLEAGQSLLVPSDTTRQGYLHLIEGNVSGDGFVMGSGDALALENEGSFSIHALERSELLFFDLPN
jgi:quercetin 2,3-dioxygenase